MMAAGLLLAPLITMPWHLYATLGLLVVGGTNLLSFTAQSLYLPNWFARNRSLAISIAFSGAGVGAIVLLPWLQTVIEHDGWRASRWIMGLMVLLVLGPLNLFVRKRPEDMARRPDGASGAAKTVEVGHPSNIVDPAWASVDWTLSRALRTRRFWWIAFAFFSGLFAWYAVQVHQTKYLI